MTNADQPSIVAIDHVQLAMPRGGEDVARTFYGGVLGNPEVPKPATPEVVRGFVDDPFGNRIELIEAGG